MVASITVSTCCKMLQASFCEVPNLTHTSSENKHGGRPLEAQLPVGCWACCQSMVFLCSQSLLYTLSPIILNGSNLKCGKIDGSMIKCSSYPFCGPIGATCLSHPQLTRGHIVKVGLPSLQGPSTAWVPPHIGKGIPKQVQVPTDRFTDSPTNT